MRKAAWFFPVATVLFAFACGGSTSTPTDTVDGSADGSAHADGTLDVAHEPTADVAHEPTADAAHDATPDAERDTTGDLAGDARATWQRLGLDNGSGPCPPQLSCSSSWVVSPDGHIAKISLGDAGVAQMTPTDLAELDSIVSSAPFLDGMAKGFVCGQPPTDVFVRLLLERDGTSQTQGVTGCVFSGPAGNLPRRVNELVTKY
jgi:hypothetical protein